MREELAFWSSVFVILIYLQALKSLRWGFFGNMWSEPEFLVPRHVARAFNARISISIGLKWDMWYVMTLTIYTQTGQNRSRRWSGWLVTDLSPSWCSCEAFYLLPSIKLYTVILNRYFQEYHDSKVKIVPRKILASNTLANTTNKFNWGLCRAREDVRRANRDVTRS